MNVDFVYNMSQTASNLQLMIIVTLCYGKNPIYGDGRYVINIQNILSTDKANQGGTRRQHSRTQLLFEPKPYTTHTTLKEEDYIVTQHTDGIVYVVLRYNKMVKKIQLVLLLRWPWS